MPIPKLFHFVYLGFTEFSYIHYLAVKTCYLVHQPRKIYLYTHFTRDTNTTWWDLIQNYVTVEMVALPKTIFGNPVKKFQHMADVIRLEKLIQRGGVYLDLDVVSLRPFGELYRERCVMGTQAPLSRFEGLCNAVIMSEPGGEFISRWYQEYKTFQSGRWDFHSVKIPLLLSRLYGHLLKILDSKKFFPITWKDTEFLYTRQFDSALRQSYVVHLWDSEWGKEHLKDASPKLLHRNSTFSYFVNRSLAIRRAPNNREIVTHKPTKNPTAVAPVPAPLPTPTPTPTPTLTKASVLCDKVFTYQKPVQDITTTIKPPEITEIDRLQYQLNQLALPRYTIRRTTQKIRSITKMIGGYARYLLLRPTTRLLLGLPKSSTPRPDANNYLCQSTVTRITITTPQTNQELILGNKNTRYPPTTSASRFRDSLSGISVTDGNKSGLYLEGRWLTPTKKILYYEPLQYFITWNPMDTIRKGLREYLQRTSTLSSQPSKITPSCLATGRDGFGILAILTVMFPDIDFIVVSLLTSKVIHIAYLLGQDISDSLSELQLPDNCRLFKIHQFNQPYLLQITATGTGISCTIPSKWMYPLAITKPPAVTHLIYQPRLRYLKYLRSTTDNSLI